MNIDINVITIKAKIKAKIKRIPISLALDDQNHLSNHIERLEPNFKKLGQQY
jgi:hypothetical protein